MGLAAATLLLANGRIAGVSGIVGQLFNKAPDRIWRGAFIAGLLVGGILLLALWPHNLKVSDLPLATIALAGLLVGIGTQLASGCTSGHGICGLARLSKRSAVAVVTFMGTAAITVLLSKWVG